MIIYVLLYPILAIPNPNQGTSSAGHRALGVRNLARIQKNGQVHQIFDSSLTVLFFLMFGMDLQT